MHFCNGMNVGEISEIHNNDLCPCMGYKTSIKDTLQHIVEKEDLYCHFNWMTEPQQEHLFTFLKEKDPTLYSNLHPAKKTIFLRCTGDNFRAAGKMPTEQILNFKH